MALRRNCGRKRDSSVPDSSAANTHFDVTLVELNRLKGNGVLFSVGIQEIRGAELPRLMPQARFISAPRRAVRSSSSSFCEVDGNATGEGIPTYRFLFVRVIWQESRFKAVVVSSKRRSGHCPIHAENAGWRGLSDPIDVSAALMASASYLRDLNKRFGNLGLAAAVPRRARHLRRWPGCSPAGRHRDYRPQRWWFNSSSIAFASFR
jgi:hypothetical protein